MTPSHLTLLCFIILSIQGITRFILSLQEWMLSHITLLDMPNILLQGFFNDLLPLCFFLAFWSITSLLLPKRWSSWILRFPLPLIAIFLLVFIAHAEYYFWREFSDRFNFIAVDYLIYTHEVINNILESYPFQKILLSISLLSFIFYTFYLYLPKKNSFFDPTHHIKVLFFCVIYYFVSPFLLRNDSFVIKKLSENGLVEIFSAFQKNELDFEKYYQTLPLQKMVEKNPPHSSSSLYVVPPQNPPNVVFILVESLSARFLETFGNNEKLTPHLDELIKQSVSFHNTLASGTRTVRGLEAVILSIPPMPGQSIVKRPHNENLFSLGGILKKANYQNKFIYGGYAYFDNMKYFFTHNFFEVVDRQDFSREEIHFANAWGVCDEDLFAKAIKEADSSYAQKKPFFEMMLTTSNHRPFTYPEGRIDIPSKSGREGAVKYTDFAIHQFIEKAKTKAWFKNTYFVIVADHSAEGRGVMEIPLQTYRIPWIIYAPELIKPQRVDQLVGQVDIAPTLLGLLGLSPQPNLFFGSDALHQNIQRAFVGTYQKLGFYKNDTLVVLGPKKTLNTYSVDPSNHSITKELPSSTLPPLVDEAIARYQYAQYLWKKHLYVMINH